MHVCDCSHSGVFVSFVRTCIKDQFIFYRRNFILSLLKQCNNYEGVNPLPILQKLSEISCHYMRWIEIQKEALLPLQGKYIFHYLKLDNFVI